MRIIATVVARDEADVIGPMIEHHLANGVTDILFTDNSSRDLTAQIAAGYPEVREIVVSDDMTHNQESHTTRMARLACKFRPDWIVHLDADEFWVGLGDIEPDIREDAAWATTAYVHPPVLGDGFRLDRQRYYIDFRGFAKEYKVIHRPNPKITVCHGNHKVEGVAIGITKAVSRHHYPIRSYSQFERKVVQGATALKARSFVCERWRKWLEDYDGNRLGWIYDNLVSMWRQMAFEDKRIDWAILSEIMMSYYGVQADLVVQTRQDMASAGILPEIRRWTPGAGNILL